MSRFSRYVVAPRNFWKTWMTHYDAYPLFLANGFGVVLVGYFGYRKMFKAPSTNLRTGGKLNPETDASLTEKDMEHNDNWLAWARNFCWSAGGYNSLLHACSYWMSANEHTHQMEWDITDREFTPSGDPIVIRREIPPSNLQTMIAMPDLSEDEIQAILDEQKEANSAKDDIQTILDELSPDGKVQLVNRLSKHADVLSKQYKVVASAHGLDENSNAVSDYCSKLKMFNDTIQVNDQEMAEILAPLKK